MRALVVALAVAVVAWPVAGQSPDNESRVTELAVQRLPHLIHGVKDPDTFPFELSAFVLSDLTIGEEPEVVDADLRRFHSDAVAEELADSYGTNALAPRRLRLEQDTVVRLGPLDAFVIGDEDYDWQGLQAASPGTNVIVRMSRPAMDRLDRPSPGGLRTRAGSTWGRCWPAATTRAFPPALSIGYAPSTCSSS